MQYKRAEDAKRAKEDYHGGTLDDRVLIVEYDIVKGTISADEQDNDGPVVRKDNNSSSTKGKTLKLQQKSWPGTTQSNQWFQIKIYV